VLQQDAAPALLADAVVERIRQRLADRSLVQPAARFRLGQPVIIQSGPLRMLDAIFDRKLDAPERVQVLVQLLGRSLAVQLDPTILKPTG
jgi:transcription antitermination factor NusG